MLVLYFRDWLVFAGPELLGDHPGPPFPGPTKLIHPSSDRKTGGSLRVLSHEHGLHSVHRMSFDLEINVFSFGFSSNPRKGCTFFRKTHLGRGGHFDVFLNVFDLRGRFAPGSSR